MGELIFNSLADPKDACGIDFAPVKYASPQWNSFTQVEYARHVASIPRGKHFIGQVSCGEDNSWSLSHKNYCTLFRTYYQFALRCLFAWPLLLDQSLYQNLLYAWGLAPSWTGRLEHHENLASLHSLLSSSWYGHKEPAHLDTPIQFDFQQQGLLISLMFRFANAIMYFHEYEPIVCLRPWVSRAWARNRKARGEKLTQHYVPHE